MRILYHFFVVLAASGFGNLARSAIVGLSTFRIITPPWCLKKILFIELERYRTPEARGTLLLASELYQMEPRQAALLMECEQINALLNIAAPHMGAQYQKNLNGTLAAASDSLPLPLNYDHILVFSYGRTGSTLLMGLLNSIPGVLIRGENYNALFHLFRFYHSVRGTYQQNSTKRAANKTTTHPWFGGADLRLSYVMSDLRRLASELLIGQVGGREHVMCLGFKEIRYLEVEQDFDNYIAFLIQLFPKALFIVNRRDHKAVVESAFWADKPLESALDELRRTDELFDRLPSLHSAVFDLNYEDISLESDRLRELYQLIGASYSAETLAPVLAQIHSYKIRPETQEKILSFRSDNEL